MGLEDIMGAVEYDELKMLVININPSIFIICKNGPSTYQLPMINIKYYRLTLHLFYIFVNFLPTLLVCI